MAGALRAASNAGDLQSAAVSSLVINIPGAIQGADYAVLAVEASGTTVTLTTPTGWTLVTGPLRTVSSHWLLRKSLVSGDANTNVTLTFSTSVRCTATMVVGSGVNTPTSGYNSESSQTSSPTFPAASGVSAGSLVVGVLSRSRTSTAAPSLTLPGWLSQAVAAASTYSTSPNQALLAGYAVQSADGNIAATSGTSSGSSSGINWLVVFPPTPTAGSGFTVAGATATGVGSAPAGTVSFGAAASTSTADPYTSVTRFGGFQLYYSINAYYNGAPVQGAQDMRPIGGTITDTAKPGVRRTLNLDLAPTVGLYDLLAPAGTTLKVYAVVTYENESALTIPMGVFDIDSSSVTEGGGKISLTAPDLWVRVQRARFVMPRASNVGQRASAAIAALIQEAVPGTVTITATSTASVGALTWDRDRDKAILDMAEAAGAWVYFDELGQATVADIPKIGVNADWLIDASATGVLISLDRKKSRSETRNVVVVSSSSSGGEAFPPQYVWDNDVNSPTYAGTDPLNNPGSAGPFGIVPTFYSSPILGSVQDAVTAGQSILARTVGIASQVSLSAGLNPKVQAFHVLEVTPPSEQPFGTKTSPGAAFGSGAFGTVPFGAGAPGQPLASTGPPERHFVDTVTHPLVVDSGQPMQIEGRATVLDLYGVTGIS